MLNIAAGTKSASSLDTYLINNSIRFRSSASAYLNKTYGANGNTKTWTYSFWAKLGTLATEMSLLNAYSSATLLTRVTYTSSSTLNVQIYNSTTYNATWETSAVFRDPSSWYHIVVICDTTGATASNYIKIYVNNVSQTLTYATNGAGTIPQNTNTLICSTTPHTIGKYQGGSNYFDGYLAESYLIDGQALTPSSFGASNAITGVWRPKAYTSTYGTNGFYLPFSDTSALTTSSNVGLGKDFSGNGNYWTTNNISITSGATYDAMIDSPTVTNSGTQPSGNYPVAYPLVPFRTYASYTNGNLTLGNGGVNTNQVAVANMTFGADKYYWETTITAVGAGANVGLMKIENISGSTTTIDLGTAAGTYAYSSSGSKSIDGTSSSYGSSYTTGDVIGFTYDGSTGVVTAYKNNTSQGTMTTLSTSSQYIAAWGCVNTTSTQTHNINFGQRPFAYTPPTGYKALCSSNLPDSTIYAGNQYMDATTYTGTGSSLSVTNSGAFKPDFVWIKGRSGATDHALYDSVRGTTIDLVSNSTAAETTQAQGLTAFGTSGFTVGTLAKLNTSSATYVGWQWKSGQGTTSSNTDGSITSTVSKNATAGFSIVTYTGNGSSSATVGHGLGVTPAMIIVKLRDSAENWFVYHKSLSANTYIQLNTTIAQTATSSTTSGAISTSPTSSTFGFTAGSSNVDNVNKNTSTIVAYCFAEIAGFSKFGSYTGNGSTDGTFVYLGFRPKFVLLKVTSAVNDWDIYDSSRDTYNLGGAVLRPDLSGAEVSASNIDFLSNGFKLRNNAATTEYNGSGSTYIYMAFAENPFKYSLAR